ncbi:hypothetical protein [Deinococcus soli (ex Cha et al. 2016)]|uniref:Uncharacterized protein n=2 Tax=Deinococcus soli (ex Cha et al. 2016) TaxID=1309411 RepID=A0AAE4BLB6_9DEIO|nr:hypothetical protein [Deinococcus soli (ex Cha et al. 2016)]MDR6218778.1 hypothetical protein [Deinococcus soli (ex Cha et al. 2016)]MDR6328575.1 hypothetical protein [Deinococcus soli (ex Cha et al. 2016)]MDR6751938.1 hypothetical protein [Deinococcus soli (ex Cha et al. 2016)]
MTKFLTLPTLLALTADPESDAERAQVLTDLSARMEVSGTATGLAGQIIGKAPSTAVTFECLYNEVADLANGWEIISITAVGMLDAAGADLLELSAVPGHDLARLLVQYARETHLLTLRDNLRSVPAAPLTPEQIAAIDADIPPEWSVVDTSTPG